MRHGLIHGQVLQMGLFVADDDIDLIFTAQAVIRYRQQSIGIGRQIDPGHLWAFVDHQVQKSGVLMGKAIVILAPDGRGDQQIDGGNGFAPWQFAGDRQPFRVLIDHGIDHMHKGFVGGEKAVTAAEYVTFIPTLQRMFRQHFQHTPIRAQMTTLLIFWPVVAEPQLGSRLIQRIELVGRSFIRAEHPEGVHIPAHSVA